MSSNLRELSPSKRVSTLERYHSVVGSIDTKLEAVVLWVEILRALDPQLMINRMELSQANS